MASIWIHMKGEKAPVKKVPNLSNKEAGVLFGRMLKEWKAASRENTIHPVFDWEVLLHRQGRLVGSLFIEFYSPPSAPEPGQPRRAKA